MALFLDTLEKAGIRLKPLYRSFRKQYLSPHGIGPWRALVPAEDFSRALAAAIDRLLEEEPAADLGDYLEFGVSRGTSLACAWRVLHGKQLRRQRLVGFDSFEGMPPEAASEGWPPGAYRSTLPATWSYLQSQGVPLDRVTLVKGWFSDTLNARTRDRLQLRKASVIMVDCDTYSASRPAVEFSLPLIERRAVVIFDDWGSRADKDQMGQREVHQECILDTGGFAAESLPAYNAASRMFLVTRLATGPA